MLFFKVVDTNRTQYDKQEKYDRDADHQAITYWLYGWLFEKMSCRQATVFEDYIRTNQC